MSIIRSGSMKMRVIVTNAQMKLQLKESHNGKENGCLRKNKRKMSEIKLERFF
jgi:hypothetical protein